MDGEGGSVTTQWLCVMIFDIRASFKSVQVLCHPKCVCWPDGPFSTEDMDVLAQLQARASTLWLRPTTAPFRELTAFLKTCSRMMTPRRLAHLLSVPLTTAEDGHKHCATFLYLVVFHSMRFWAGDCQALAGVLGDLPLCPHVGVLTKATGWSPAMSLKQRRCHPGRLALPAQSHVSQSLYSIVHVTRDTYNGLTALLMHAGAYPVCVCGETMACAFRDERARLSLSRACSGGIDGTRGGRGESG